MQPEILTTESVSSTVSTIRTAVISGILAVLVVVAAVVLMGGGAGAQIAPEEPADTADTATLVVDDSVVANEAETGDAAPDADDPATTADEPSTDVPSEPANEPAPESDEVDPVDTDQPADEDAPTTTAAPVTDPEPTTTTAPAVVTPEPAAETVPAAPVAVDDDHEDWMPYYDCIDAANPPLPEGDFDWEDIDLDGQAEAMAACDELLPPGAKAEAASWDAYDTCMNAQFEALTGEDPNRVEELDFDEYLLDWEAIEDAANEACEGELLPEILAELEAYEAYDECLLANGYDPMDWTVPDMPDFDWNNGIYPDDNGDIEVALGDGDYTVTITNVDGELTIETTGEAMVIDWSDPPEVEAAYDACSDLDPEIVLYAMTHDIDIEAARVALR